MRVSWVPYGRPAAEALRAAIAAGKSDGPLEPVTVVVPSNYVGVAARRLLASGELGPVSSQSSGIVAVSFVTVQRLAELLGASTLAGLGRRPVPTAVITAALRACLQEEPGAFAPVASHPATEAALASAYKELRDISPAALQRLAAQSARAGDVVRLHLAARARLQARFYDEQDLVATAVQLTRDNASRARELGIVVVYLPQHLSLHSAVLINEIARAVDVLVLAGTTGNERADRTVRRALARLASASPEPVGLPQAVAGPVPPGPPGALVPVSPERTRIVTTSDADEEVRAAVRAVVSEVRRGTPLERIAVLYASREPYARLVDEQLNEAGIAYNGVAVAPLAARAAGRTLLGLLDLATSGFRREDVFAWLAGAPLYHEGHPVPVTVWERISREASVVAGRPHWDHLLSTYAEELEARALASEADPYSPPWRSQRLRRDAESALRLRSFVLGLFDDLAEAALKPRGWAEHVSWVRRHLDELLGGARHRSRWPDVEQKAAELTERCLDRLACLGAVEGPVPLEVFARTFQLEAGSDIGRVGRTGEGVLVGTVLMGVGLDLDFVCVLGLAEGSFPSAVSDDSLLPDSERQAGGGELDLRSDVTERQHHELLAALAGAKRHLLCVPRGDLRRSNERAPSRWVSEIASALAGERLFGTDLLSVERPWLEHVASFYAGLRRAAFPATEQEHRLQDLLARTSVFVRSPGLAPVSDFQDQVLRAGHEVAAARCSPLFTRFDGNLDGLAVPSPADGATSATRLESWAVCPFAYFVREVLHVEPVENPEDRLRISPLDLGSLVHEVLERFMVEVLSRPPGSQPELGQPWPEPDRRRLLEIAAGVCDRYEARGLVGRPIFWQRDRSRLLGDFERFLLEDDAYRARHATRPVAAELSFGLPGAALGTVELFLPDGRSVALRGKADRLDVAADGTLDVVDYKTGKTDSYSGLSEADPDARGTKLQLVVYALAARAHQGRREAQVRSAYWFISARGGFRRVGYPVTAEVLAHVSATVGQVVANIEAGVFPHYPAARSSSSFVECPYCDPDGLGVADLRRQLEKKRGSPALQRFLDLVEPVGGPGTTSDFEVDEASGA